MADSGKWGRRGNARLALLLAFVGAGLYLSIQLVWAAKGW